MASPARPNRLTALIALENQMKSGFISSASTLGSLQGTLDFLFFFMLEMFDVGIDFLGLAELICPVKQHTKKKIKGNDC